VNSGMPADSWIDSADDNDRLNEDCLRAQPAAKRYLVKMSLSLKTSEMKHTLVSALSLRPEGMLIESPQPLAVGKAAHWSFMGVSELRGVSISGTILQEKPRPEWADQNRYYLVKFDEEARTALERLGDCSGGSPGQGS